MIKKLLNRLRNVYHFVKRDKKWLLYNKFVRRMAYYMYDDFKIDKKRNIEINNVHDGYFFDKAISETPTIYSFGVGGNINFGLNMIDKVGADVYGFDPTNQSKKFVENKKTPRKYHFYKLAVGAEDETKDLSYLKEPSDEYVAGTLLDIGDESKGSENVTSKSIRSIMDMLGHTQVDMVKMDIEGGEYRVLRSMVNAGIKPGQIALEFHPHILNIKNNKSIVNIYGWKVTADFIRFLRKSGYLLCHRSNQAAEFLFVNDKSVD